MSLSTSKGFRLVVISLAAVMVVSLLSTVAPLHAQSVDVGLQAAEQVGLGGGDPRVIVARVIQVALGFLGILALGLLLYAGFLWMTAAGNDEQVSSAKTVLRNGLIGLIIVVSAFGIVSFVISQLTSATGSTGSLLGRRGGAGFLGGGAGFPLGVIDQHYPERDQKNVSRNTNIMVSFVEPMLAESLLEGKGTPDASDDQINAVTVRISRSTDDPATGPFIAARAALSDDARNLIIDPIDLLGSAEQNTNYRVTLGEGITTAAGKAAFGNFGAYSWEFEVGTFVDIEPPRVESVFPQTDSTHPRNVVIQINFNEAMNPLAVSGETTGGFTNIAVRNQNGELVSGRFSVSNQYRTAEFVTNDLCGTNSCGQEVFCLPGDAKFTVHLRAATVSSQPPTAVFPADGIIDASGNSLDGNVDGAGQGSPADDYSWSFQTTNEVDLRAPVVASVTPLPFATTVPLDSEISLQFSKPLWMKSVNRQNIQIPDLGSYQLLSENDGRQTTVRVQHGGLSQDTTYTPVVASNVRDIYQNCYQPCIGP